MRDLDNSSDLAAMRVDYGGLPHGGNDDVDLDETWLAGGWEPLLRHWIEQATAVGIAEPNAMVLATVSLADGTPRPVARTVLCKGLSPRA